MQTGDDILFTAPGPDFGTIASATTEIVGTPGNGFNVYWIVTHFPIGSVLSGPFPQKDSPNVLDDENYIHISWLPAPGASSYDLLVTKDLVLPRQPGQFWLAGGLTDTEFRDTGQGLAFYDVAGIPLGAPQEEHIYFNNRDFKQPTLQFIPWPIQVSSIIFEDGSQISSAGGGGFPGGPNLSVQFNDNGIFGGTGSLAWVQGSKELFIENLGIRGDDGGGNASIDLFSNGNISVSTNSPGVLLLRTLRVGINGIVFPQYTVDAIGDINITGQYRINGVPIGGGGGTPAGANTQIQYNNNNAFGASANLTWTSNTRRLNISGNNAEIDFDGFKFASRGALDNMVTMHFTGLGLNVSGIASEGGFYISTIGQPINLFTNSFDFSFQTIFSIGSDGNVGLSSSPFNPNLSLSVAGAIFGGDISGNNITANGDININDPDGANRFAYRINGVPLIGTSGAPAIFVDPQNRRVAIGTQNPQAALEIAGNYDGNDAVAFRNSFSYNAPPVTLRLSTNPGRNTVMGMGLQTSPVFGYWIQSQQNDPLLLNPAGNNVGIGTDNPDALLTIGTGFESGYILKVYGDAQISNSLNVNVTTSSFVTISNTFTVGLGPTIRINTNPSTLQADIYIPNLPSADPGPGFLWYDPTDQNRVKFSP